MKRTFRIAGLCALMALAAVSCKKSESVNGSVTVRATITQPTSDSKTHTDGVSVLWNQNDQIVVYTADKDNPQLFTTSANNVADATFSGDMEVTDGCYAFYPAEGVSVINDDHFKLPLSAIQTLTANSFSTATYPMCAVYANDKFEFHSPYGLLALQLQGTACIGSIELTSGDADEKLSGYYEISDDEPVFHGEDVSVTLSCSEGLQLTSEVTTVYFVLPGGTLGNNFSIVVKDTEGTELLNKASSVTTNIVAAEYILVMPALTVNAASVVDLSTLTEDYEAQNNDILIGTLDGYKQITVADGATITLRNATIAHEPNPDYYYAGIACVGDATIVLEGTNTVQPCFVHMPSIHVSPNHTLTLRGTGSLAATVSGGAGAAIGAGIDHPCGNIVIESGTITASAVIGAGIGGSASNGACGDITILGGTVNATSLGSSGIGGGQNGNSCGNISILGGSVTAKGGNTGAANIGSASGGNCGNITISNATVVATYNDAIAGIGAGAAGSCGAITISNADVTASGQQIGIGGSTGGPCGDITLSGGNITASSNYTAIGSGPMATCGDINIDGGTIIANGRATGIGAYGGNSTQTHGNISIHNATVTATATNSNGVGIGIQASGHFGNITIYDDVVSVTAVKGSSAFNCIGRGYNYSDITVGTITVGGTVYPDGVDANQADGVTFLYPAPFVPEGIINGKFSVSSTKQVYFAQGNLQYIGTTWRFADHQWEYLGNTQSDGNRDLFGWGTKNNPDNISGSGYAWAEWGENAIANGGNTENYGWYTLSKDEWQYLFSGRTGAADKSGLATVTIGSSDYVGVVILPDSWTLPAGCSFVPATPGTGANVLGAYSSNTYDATQWEAMESAGAVFLPAAGNRITNNSNNVTSAGEIGFYWTSTESVYGTSNNVYFYDGECVYSSAVQQKRGQSVRLVLEAE